MSYLLAHKLGHANAKLKMSTRHKPVSQAIQIRQTALKSNNLLQCSKMMLH
jgi:hypothetical protein